MDMPFIGSWRSAPEIAAQAVVFWNKFVTQSVKISDCDFFAAFPEASAGLIGYCVPFSASLVTNQEARINQMLLTFALPRSAHQAGARV
jgi:hypothetical protein